MTRMLIVDDEDSVLRILSTLFKSRGYETSTASDGENAMEVLLKEKFDVLLTDVRMRPMDGLALLKFARSHDPEMQVIMLTAYASVESAIESLKVGAFDYITKPFDVGELLKTVERAIAFKAGAVHQPDAAVRKDVCFFMDDVIADSPSMQEVCKKIEKIAPTETLVMITGEAGCGKGLLARALHNRSKRREKEFKRVNCAILPEPLLEAELLGYERGAAPGVSGEKKGLFEQVRGGTLFIEEIGCLPARIQDTLLHIIQDKKVQRIGGSDSIPVNTRLIVSSNSDIEIMVKRGIFREDLFFRLNVVPLRVNPLRERIEDIVPLFALLLGKVMEEGAEAPDISPEVQAILKSYSWPGNAEELENAAIFAARNLKKNIVVKESLPQKISDTPVKEGLMDSGASMKAISLKAFLRAEGAEKDLKAAEEGIRAASKDARS